MIWFVFAFAWLALSYAAGRFIGSRIHAADLRARNIRNHHNRNVSKDERARGSFHAATDSLGGPNDHA